MRLSLLAVCSLFVSSTLIAQPQYITDDLYLFLHAGPSTKYRIIGSVNAGEAVELSGSQQGNYSEIIDSKGRRGWVESKMLQQQPSERLQLPQLREQLEASQQQLASIDADWQHKTADNERQLQQQNARVDELQQQLQQQQQRLLTLEEENQQLRAKVDLQAQDENRRWLMIGGAVLGSGIILGLLLPFFPRRKKRHDRWMN